VVQLPRPDGSTGTEELFGLSSIGRDVMRAVSDEDVRALKPKRRKKRDLLVVDDDFSLPQTLCDAILTFAVASAVRLLRGQTGRPNTMLVHVSQLQADQTRIGGAIDRQMAAWRDQERIVPGSLALRLGSALDDLGDISLPSDREKVLREAEVNLSRANVVVLNSTTGEELEYDAKPDRQVIAVGGNRLSRGLTLEGLTIAYFLRTTTMADTLLQMARWYGFRTGYEDLIRIWTTEGIAQWFVELALVEESLRDSITALNRAGRRPTEMAIQIRAHSDLMLTSKVKSRMQETSSRSWSGENPQTILLPLRNPAILERNAALTEALLTAHPATQDAFGGSLAYDVPASDIARFLDQFIVHEETLAFQTGMLANWIRERSAAGELVTWTIFVANPQRERQVLLGSRPYGLVQRSLTATESIGILTEPRHEGVDLHGGPEGYRSGTTYNARAMRQSRPSSRGLLMIYPLDPQPLQAHVRTVIGLGLSLPKTSDESVAYVVNRGVADEQHYA
jgi:Z1 domain